MPRVQSGVHRARRQCRRANFSHNETNPGAHAKTTRTADACAPTSTRCHASGRADNAAIEANNPNCR